MNKIYYLLILLILVSCNNYNKNINSKKIPKTIGFYRKSFKLHANIPKTSCNQKSKTIVKNWVWPAKGKVVPVLNGINIIGKQGNLIMATAPGKVVYSGNNLRGYGNLIIIKHNNNFLSAYAHNQQIFVKEQQLVNQGQVIATMGNSNNLSLLYFEIRHQGKPINPLTILRS